MTTTRLKPKHSKIPITVLTGFLGSGKTTLLNYILTHNQGLKIGVVVNDFGAINIDAKLVTARTDSKLELSNGCICCTLGSLDLQEAIAQFVYPDSPIDYIVIEASGLADPYDLLVTLRDSLTIGVRLDSIIALIDAANIEHNAEANQLALKQAEYADFVVVNKIDLVSKQKAGEISQLIRAINPRARVFATTKGKLDLHLILDTEAWQEETQPAKTGEGHDHDHDHSKHAHEHYSQVSFTSKQPFEPMRFQEFVNKQMPLEIYRAKGIVDLGHKGHDRKYVFQLVGARSEIAWQNWHDEPPATHLVFIGRDIDEPKLRQLLHDCIDDQPDEVVTAGYEVRLPKKAD